MPSLKSYSEILITSQSDGAAITAAAATSTLPAAAKYTFEPGFFGVISKAIRVRASGRITIDGAAPGSARFDLRMTSPVPTTVVVFDSLAMNLNTVDKTTVHWMLDVTLVTRVIGSAAQLFPGPALWASEALIGSPLPTVGGSGMVLLPYNTAPVLGTAFDATVQQTLDLFFTQTVTGGTPANSLTLHNYLLEALN